MYGWSSWMFHHRFSTMVFLTFSGSAMVWFESIDLICPQQEDELKKSRRVRCCSLESSPKPPRLLKSCCLHSVSVAFDLEVCLLRSGADIKCGCKSQVMLVTLVDQAVASAELTLDWRPGASSPFAITKGILRSWPSHQLYEAIVKSDGVATPQHQRSEKNM